ncbi:MAG: DUF2384 domain-containing protein [Nocardioidaceae bacterium]
MLVKMRAPATRYEIGEWPDLREDATRVRLTPAAVTAMHRLATQWKLTAEQMQDLLGGVSASTWHAWRNRPPRDLGVDRLTRASLLLGIHTALQAIHSAEIARMWIQLPNTNPVFGGRTPLEVMREGGIPAMVEVRALLDGRRGGR